MSLQEKLIRNRVVQELKSVPGLPERVYAARYRTLGPKLMPCVAVYNDGGRVVGSTAANGGRKYERQFELRIGIVLSTEGKNDPGAGLADRLDEFGELVEAWMFANENFDGVWVEALLTGTETGTPQESKEPTVARVIKFDVTYFDYAPKLSAEMPSPLEEVHVDHDLAPSDGQIDASDTHAIPQP